jgi:uncharacterized protein with HEPN domain
LSRDKLYVEHILACITRIAEYSSDGRDVFLTNTLLQDGILRNLQILAESAGRISESTRELAPQIPWHQVRGFRNVVVHDYLGIDMHFGVGDRPG